MIAAIILAAGRSTRMGQPKPLLSCGAGSGHSFLSRLIQVLKTSELAHISVVGRGEDVDLHAEVARCGASFVENRTPDAGQLSSLLAGLADARRAFGEQLEAILVCPVDAPLVSPAVIHRMMRAAEASDAQILRAAHAGKHGHPVLFRRATFAELEAADPAVGARSVVRANPERVENVEVADAGVTLDFDTPEEYQRYFGTLPSTSR